MGLSKSQVRKKVDNSLCVYHDNYWYINSEGSKNIVDNGREDRGQERHRSERTMVKKRK